MNGRVERQTVDLSAFPDLVVIYLGMRVNAWTGVKTLVGLGPQIRNSVDQKPDGLLLHENFIMSVIPLHLGMRQYWRDFDALEAWSRSPPHRDWWRDFLRSSRGTGFWHEAYFMRGGMEAVYDDVPTRLGFGQFAPLQPARDPLKSLVFSGLERPITDVFVDGEHILIAGKLKTIDETAVIEALNRGQRAALQNVPSADYARRSTNEVFPLSLPITSAPQ